MLPANAQLIGSIEVAFRSNGPGFVGFVPYYVIGLSGYLCLAAIVTVFGTGVARVAMVGWTRYHEEQKAVQEANRERQRFTSVGELVTIRTTVASNLSTTERLTEVETTVGIFVVEGEVGTVRKGVAVSKNEDELRIGGLHSRTFPLRAI